MNKIYLPLIFLLLLSRVFHAQTFVGNGAPIPDDGNSLTLDIPVSGLLPDVLDTQNFGIESVCLNLTHTWNADLAIALRAPDGTVISLFSNIGGDTDGFINTCLSGNSSNSIFSGSYPYTGTFRPFGDMGILNNGQNPNGVWQLLVLDTYPFADVGELFDWSITFGNQPCKPFPFMSSDLPLVKIFTNGQPIPNEPKIDAQMIVIDNGPGIRNYLNQGNAAYNGLIGIETHGNSTQGFPKKSFDIETREADGSDKPVALLGLPKGSDFVLGANFSDKTLMRNALSYDLSRRIGQYASRTRFCELFVDNTYQGVYCLTEKIRQDNDRVDISKLTELDTAGPELTGGYILKIDWNGSPGWNSQFSQPNSPNIYTYFQHVYPRADEILPIQAEYIRGFIDSFEVSLAGPDFQDTALGWRHFADETSFFDFLFINEMSKNVDGYRLSTFFHKERADKGGKIKMGPAWDFDLGWYNADYCESFSSSGWAFDINYVCGDAGVPFWWERLYQDTLFVQNMACYWHSLRAGSLRTDSVFAVIDSMAGVVGEAQERNFEYWPILGIYIWPNPGALPDTYTGEVQKMKNWVSSRLIWLDGAFGVYTPVLNAEFTATPSSAFDWSFSAEVPGAFLYTWDFDDGATSNEPSPQHQFPGTGTYKVTLSVSTPFGCSSTSKQIIHIVNTGTSETIAGTLKIAPNPADTQISIELPEELSGSYTLRLYNGLGERVVEQVFDGGEKRRNIDVSGLAAGVYALELEGVAARWMGRVLIH